MISEGAGPAEANGPPSGEPLHENIAAVTEYFRDLPSSSVRLRHDVLLCARVSSRLAAALCVCVCV